MPIWSQGQNVEGLATRVFRFFDENQDAQINLLQFFVAAAVLLRTDTEVRVKFFYLLHLVSCPTDEADESPDGAEEATEATEFFRTSTPSSFSLCSEYAGDDVPKVLVPLLLKRLHSRFNCSPF